MTKYIVIASIALATAAFAQGKGDTLACPAGTKQMGGAKTFLESTMCMKVGTDGTRLYHGPFIAYWPDGSKQAEGQYLEGWRSGHWVFFDQHGVKTGETEFARGDYHGRRITFYPNGQIQMDETYDHGKQLTLKTFDQNGAAVAPAQLGVRATK